MPPEVAHYPYRAPIDAYGNGGFRFAGMSHKGSLLLLPSGIHAWDVTAPDRLTAASFDKALAERAEIDFLLLGMGAEMRLVPPSLRQPFIDAGVGLEPMSTGSAARTFNVLLAEGRKVAAALIAVE